VGQTDAIIAEGFSSMEELGEMLLKRVQSVCTTISKLPNNRGGIRIGCNLVRRLKGLVWWIRDHQRRDQVAIEADWDLDTCKEAIAYMDMEAARAEEESKIEPPGRLKDGDWVRWELKLVNFLQNMLGTSGIPLNCIISFARIHRSTISSPTQLRP
jgi:hypothetical protein